MCLGPIRHRPWGSVYRLTYGQTEERHHTRTQAIRAMARAIHAQPLTAGERFAFNRWYTNRNYRSAATKLHGGHRYELRVSVGGERRIFAIHPPPHTPQAPVTREDVTA